MKKSIIWQLISTQSRGSLKKQSSITTHISSFLICLNSVSCIELYSWITSKILVLATPHIVVCYLLSPRSRIYRVYSEQLLCICKSQSGVGVQIGNDSMSSLNPAEPVIDDRHKLFSKEFIYYYTSELSFPLLRWRHICFMLFLFNFWYLFCPFFL